MTREARKQRYYVRRFLALLVERLSTVAPRWAALEAVITRLSFVRSVYGPYLLNTPGDRTFELCVGGYGSLTADAIRRLNHRFTFLDIGANLGLFSLLAADNPNCERVIAFEPLPDIFRNLEANIRRNGAARIEPIRGAVATTSNAVVDLSFDPRHSGMSRIVESGLGRVRAPVISAATLDSLLPEPPGAVVAKIDVEGSEVDVLSTLRHTRIYRSIVEILIEVSERHLGGARRSMLLRMLEDDGYEELSRSGPPDHYDARYRRTTRPSPTMASWRRAVR